MRIDEYFGDWKTVIDLEWVDSRMKELSHQEDICPKLSLVFQAFRLCPLNRLKCVILGRDPSLNTTGIAFSSSENSLSPMLKVLKESVIDYTIPHKMITFDPSLWSWEKQGVLMLNTSLTTTIEQDNHSEMWKVFIRTLLERLSETHPGLVYVLIGKEAQSFSWYIKEQENNILTLDHPNKYVKDGTRMPSDVWRKVNEILKEHNTEPIEWYNEN